MEVASDYARTRSRSSVKKLFLQFVPKAPDPWKLQHLIKFRVQLTIFQNI